MNNKKIAVIGLKGLPAFGGAAAVGENLINQLKARYDFTVYSVNSHTDKVTNNISGYRQIVFNKTSGNSINTFVYYLKTLFHVMFVAKYDLIFLHHSESGFITPILKMKYKVILTIHGVFHNKTDPKFNKISNFLFRRFEKLNMKYADVIISVSQQDALSSKKKYKRDVVYIPNGINIPKLEPVPLEKSYWLFAASRIYEIKGLHLLLEAMKTYKFTNRLKVIGDLDQKLDYKKKILTLSQGLNIDYIDRIKNKTVLFQIIKNSRLFIFPSIYEAMSMMLLEVASLSVPIIASDISANKSIFGDDEMLFFKSNDPTSLGNKLMFAERNKKLLLQNANNAFTKVTSKYNWKNISKNYENIFNSFLV